MKKRILCTTLLLGASSPTVFAASGTVKFTGEIVQSACDLSSDSKNKEVYLGKWPTTALAASGQATTPKTFSLNVVGCDATEQGYAMRINGQEDATNSALLALDSSTNGNTAKNVGIRVTTVDNKAVLNQSLENSLVFKPNDDKTAEITLKAYYEATGQAEDGLAAATANVTIEYK